MAIKRRKVFIDVGVHVGQTLEEILWGKYSFDKVYGFEPLPKIYTHLVTDKDYNGYTYEQMKTSKYHLEIFNYGLLDKTTTQVLYGDETSIGASIYRDRVPQHQIEGAPPPTEIPCQFMEASEFFRKHILYSDLVIMKVNCEGSEVLIMDNLLSSGEIWKISNVLLDFDVHKFEGHEHDEKPLLQKMKQANFTNYTNADDVMFENGRLWGTTHQQRIERWLQSLPFYTDLLN